MVVAETAIPTKQQEETLRSLLLREVASAGEEKFLKSDIDRLKNEAMSGNWMHRFLLHQECIMDDALKMAMTALKFRFEHKVDASPDELAKVCDESWFHVLAMRYHPTSRQSICQVINQIAYSQEITPEVFGDKIMRVGGFFPRGRDKDGCRVFVIKPKTRTDEKTEDLKKFLLYWFERLEREENGNKITVFIELTNCGVASMDLDFTAFLVALLRDYYPAMINYLIMFEMPWLLNAVWKVIKGWLPPKSISLVKFLDRKTLGEYIAPDQALKEWGGKDDYQYSFVPEVRSANGSPLANGYSSEDLRKKVTFAVSDDTGSMDTELSDGSNQSRVLEGQLIKLKPSEEITFRREENETSGSIVLTNISTRPVSYKIKITSPDKYSVRPSTGVLEPDGSATISMTVKAGYPSSSIVRDKFLVMAFELDSGAENPTQALLAELWRTKTESAQHFRLKCSLAPGDANDHIFQAATPPPVKQYDNVLSKLDDIGKCQTRLETRLRWLQGFTVLQLVLILVVLYLMLAKSTTDAGDTCSAI